MSTVIVVGAINLDCLVYIPGFPNKGDNMRAKDLRFSLGGRGANQAVALTNLTVAALLLGKVGNDFAGDYVLSILRNSKISTEYILKSNSSKTGICSILVSADGENTILGFPAINRMVQPDFLSRLEYLFARAQWLSISLEYPLDTVELALKLAKKYKLKTVLDPSPLIEIPEHALWTMVDYVLPNKKEVEILTGEKELLQGATVLKDWGAREVIIKQGAQGCSFLERDNLINVPAFPVKTVIDTTGAGDLFNAAFIYGLMESDSILKAAQIANLVASYSVQKPGTSESFPRRREIDWEQLEKKKRGLLF